MSQLATESTAKSSPWIWLLLLVTIAATIWTAMQDDAEEAQANVDLFAKKRTIKTDLKTANKQDLKVQDMTLAKAPTQMKREKKRGGLIDWEKLDRSHATKKPKDLFQAHSWVVAPPPPPPRVAPPPPPPRAPEVPFEYMGRLDDGPQGNLIYLAAGDKSYSVKLGSKVDGFWRLDQEDEGALYFTYLPLDLPQTLSKGEGLPEPTMRATAGTMALPLNAF